METKYSLPYSQPSLDPMRSQVSPIHIHSLYFYNVRFNIMSRDSCVSKVAECELHYAIKSVINTASLNNVIKYVQIWILDVTRDSCT
jgi:dTDP-glucose pyrophosphorylase